MSRRDGQFAFPGLSSDVSPHPASPLRAIAHGLTLALLLGGCATNAPSVAPRENGVGESRPADESIVDARLLKMLDERRVDTLIVDEALRTQSPDRRARAALAIGQVRMRARFVALRQLLVDADTAVAANAAYALGVAKDSAAVSVLARAVAGAPDVVAREAAWALGEIGEPARTVINVALGEGSARPWSAGPLATRSAVVQAAVIGAAVKLRPVPVSVVTPWLQSPDARTVRSAAYVVSRTRLSGGVRAMLALQRSPDAETRSYVARALARSAAGDSLAARSREALSVLLKDHDAHVRVNAAQSVATYGASAVKDVQRALIDDDFNVRIAALDSVAVVFGRDRALWRAAFDGAGHPRIAQLLLTAARSVGIAEFVSEEAEWLKSEDWQHRKAVLDARLAGPRANRAEIAKGFLADRDPRVVAAALGALNATVVDSEARALATVAWTHPIPQVRAAAYGVVARRASSRDITLALDALRRAASDPESDARVGALRILAAAWTRDSARVPAETREELASVSLPLRPEERRVVAGVTPMAAWVRAASPPVRPLSDYQQLVQSWMRPGAPRPRAEVRTDHGTIVIELFAREAPLVVEAFMRLARDGYYRNTYFHRVVPNFVVQDGDSRGDGSGGAGFTLRESYSRRRHDRGAVGLATSGPDTGGSQYYFCLSPQPHLDGGYTVFGRVISGEDAMDDIVQGERMLSIRIK